MKKIALIFGLMGFFGNAKCTEINFDYRAVIIQAFDYGCLEPSIKSFEGTTGGVYIAFPDLQNQMTLPLEFSYKGVNIYIFYTKYYFFYDIPYNTFVLKRRNNRQLLFTITNSLNESFKMKYKCKKPIQ